MEDTNFYKYIIKIKESKMILDKEQLILTLQEKAQEKIEILRQELAQSLFDKITEETFFVYDKKDEDVVGGPFSSKAKAMEYVKEMDSKTLVIMTERALEGKLKTKSEETISEEKLELKDLDSVLDWFDNNNYLEYEFDFDKETGVLKLNGKEVATKGQDGSFSIDITACKSLK